MKTGNLNAALKPILLFAAILFFNNANAQILNKFGKKLSTAAEKQTEKLFQGALKSAKSDETRPTEPKNYSENARPDGTARAAYKSKFDFIPGEEVYYFYDFSDVGIGDVPEGWQIDGSAEVVEVDGYPGHYLMLNDHSSVIPEMSDDLSEDLTIQFDLICTDPFAWGSNQLYFAFANTNINNTPKGQEDHLGSVNNTVFWVSFHPGSQAAAANKGHGEYKLRARSGITQGAFQAESFADKGEGRLAKVSVWRQKRRVRVYVNENKVLDLPTILPADMKVNTLAWSAYSYYNDNKYFIGNIRIAKGLPDSRKNILQSGKYVTTGITFDVNSAEIRPESYGVLRDIATNLKAASGAKVTIVGHTDNDGDENANLVLSKKRAESVKKSLVNDFGVDAGLLQTDGKGESEPVSPNDTPQNKANNRRVEFLVNR